MAEELIELGRHKTRKRVCTKVKKVKGGYIVVTYDMRTGRVRDYIAAPCLRTKSKRKALVIPTKRAALDYSRKCKLDRCRIR